jgi:potassium/hydrogen antiporter
MVCALGPVEPAATAVAMAVIGGLLVAAALVSPLSTRTGVPALVIVLGLGMLAGSEGLGGIPFDDYQLGFRLGTIALVLILFDGGLGTPRPTLRRVAARAAALATVGVVATAALVAAIALLVGIPTPLAVLVGAVVSSTDAAAVFAALRGSRVRLQEQTAATLEVESGLNDPLAVFLTMTATEVVLSPARLDAAIAVVALRQVVIGVAGGVVVGLAGRLLLRAAKLPVAGLYPVVTLAIACLAYGVPTLLDGSGFLAVYLAGVLLAEGPLPYRAGIRRVHDALAWLAQLSMFLMLGLLVFPSRLVPVAPQGLVLGVTLALVARPLAVLAVMAPFPAALRERLFIAWVGLRGAVPIILATYPVLRGVPHADTLFHLVFFVVLVNAIVPAAEEPPTPPATVELVSLRDYAGEFVWYTVERASAVAGAALHELPLPSGCVLTLLLRGDAVIAPRGDTVVQPGDHVCLFVTRDDRSFLDLVFGRGDAE